MNVGGKFTLPSFYNGTVVYTAMFFYMNCGSTCELVVSIYIWGAIYHGVSSTNLNVLIWSATALIISWIQRSHTSWWHNTHTCKSLCTHPDALCLAICGGVPSASESTSVFRPLSWDQEVCGWNIYNDTFLAHFDIGQYKGHRCHK